MPARKLSSATPYDSFTLWTEGFSFRFWTEGLRGTEFGSYYWLLLSNTFFWLLLSNTFLMDHESFWDACICSLWSVEHRSARHQTKFHMAENREVDRSQGKGGFIKLPIVFQRQIIHGVQLTIWPTSLFSYLFVIKQAKSCKVWARKKCCGVASTRRLAALEAFPADYYTDGWTWVPTLRLLCCTLITDTTLWLDTPPCVGYLLPWLGLGG